jgi:hypothetical protein
VVSLGRFDWFAMTSDNPLSGADDLVAELVWKVQLDIDYQLTVVFSVVNRKIPSQICLLVVIIV